MDEPKGENTEIYYFDSKGRPVDDPDKAVMIKIRELNEKGELVNETTMFKAE
jgi:hypothetical protein